MKTPGFLTNALMSIVALTATSIFASEAQARRGVGLGVGAGVAVPTAEMPFKLAPAWGFYTDIPLLDTFHITPSALVYNLNPKSGGEQSATDISINFKFVVPLARLDLFAGVTAGVTSTNKLTPHMGGLLGLSMNLVSNVDGFINVNYKYVAQEQIVHDIQIFAGPLFRFSR
jgi:hypothetical protein